MHWRLYSSFLLKQSKHLYNMSHSQSCFYLRLSAFYLTFTRRWMQSGETRPNDTLACRLEQPNIKPPTSILSCLESSGTMTAVSKCVDDHPRATCYYMLHYMTPLLSLPTFQVRICCLKISIHRGVFSWGGSPITKKLDACWAKWLSSTLCLLQPDWMNALHALLFYENTSAK